jgi:hypothetical protein
MFLAAILKAYTQAEEPTESAAEERQAKDETTAADATGGWPVFRAGGGDVDERTRWV